MHSRIIELSKEPVLKQERISEASIPEWFCNTIADYTDANTDRDHDIKWFLSRVGNYVDVAEDGQSFTFRPKAKQMHFERSYHTFLDKVCELTGISLGAFVGETKYDIGMAMYTPPQKQYEEVSLDDDITLTGHSIVKYRFRGIEHAQELRWVVGFCRWSYNE